MTFKSNVSGNPSGRPKGTGHRQQLFNSLVEPHREALFDTAIKLALSGNESMLRLFLERMLPAKPNRDTISIHADELDLTKTESILSLGKTILEGVSNGEFTPEEGKILMGTIDTQAKLIETHELTQRIDAIEKTLKRRK